MVLCFVCTKRNKAAIVQLACEKCAKHEDLLPAELDFYLGNWTPPGSGSSGRRRSARLNITCTVRGLCSHPCPRRNQRASVQWNPCLGFWKNCSLLPHLQRSLSLNKSWNPAKACGFCCLRCSPQTRRWCCRHRGATRARISSLSSHSTWPGWSVHLLGERGEESQG